MSRPFNLRLLSQGPDTASASRREAELLLEDFLDHVCAPLVGVVPLQERQGLRAEVCEHLEALIAEHEYQGHLPEDAARLALREFGEPWQLGQEFLAEWCQGVPDGSPRRILWMAFRRAFGFFGVATVMSLLLIEWYALGSPPEFVRPLIFVTALLAPVVAGALTGLTALPHVGRGTAYALSVLIFDALLTAILLRPQWDCFSFVGLQVLCWLPAGCLSAVSASAATRSLRRRRFLKYAR